MSALSSSLSVNLSQILQKKVHLHDLQYDYYCKYLAAGCRSQSGPEIVILEKDGSSGDSAGLRVVSTLTTRCDPILLSWAPPQFGRVLIVVLSDNSVSYYRQSSSGPGCQLSLYHEKVEVQKSISCMSVGVAPGGELLCAVGSASGSVGVIFCEGSFECVNFQGHYGGVSSASFVSSDGCVDRCVDGRQGLLATGGSDGCVKIWQLVERQFKLLKTLTFDCESKCLPVVKCLSWSKNAVSLAVITASELFLFGRAPEWSDCQRVSLPRACGTASVSFNNDRLVVSCDGESLVYRPDERGTYVLSCALEGPKD
ncbi:COPII-coated vesicle component Sec13 [Babesia caballi]|uniref:COPII-coated vesicle component Sec13 n=1 Tax=Babesia caballi TaxID=5871 RepID=A0AAV4LQH0_BABCB|nr:COPII-coated vesicle component Sec13 [Babesia caballi]GIX61713.1 COPII-coated vesicle component Sec13 [Babesia caballi]